MVVSRPGPLGRLVMWNVEEENGPEPDYAIIQHRSMVAMTVTGIKSKETFAMYTNVQVCLGLGTHIFLSVQ